MKYVSAPGRVLLLALVAAAACSSPPPPESRQPPPLPSSPPMTAPSTPPLPNPLPDVIAKVNGIPILTRHARIIVDTTFRGQTPTEAQRTLEYHRAMEQLIVRELIRQEAEARKLPPDPEAMERIRKQVRSEHEDDAAYTRFLAEQGLDEKTFLKELAVRNVVEKVVKAETEKVPSTIPEQEARAYYEANRSLFESGGRTLPFEDVRNRIQEQVAMIRRQEALNGLLVRLRSAARIEKFI